MNMKYRIVCFFLMIISLSLLTCGKYRPAPIGTLRGEWIYSVRICQCAGPPSFRDTIWPHENYLGIHSADLYITQGGYDNLILMYLNGSLSNGVNFDDFDSGSGIDYPGNLDDGIARRYTSSTESFYYSTPSNVAGYERVLETPEFPFKSDEYQNEMDTFTVNFFRIIQ